VIAPFLYSQETPAPGFTVSTDPILPAQETHPSLYFHSEDVIQLQNRKTDPAYSFYWNDIQSDVSQYRYVDPAYQDENDRPKLAKTMAFWWIMEQDTLAGDKAIDALLLAFDGVPQTGDKPYDEIYRATWLQNYCAAYDWIYDQLSTEQDSIIRAKIAGETQYLRDNLTQGERLAPRPHNHRSKPAWAICTAALTLSNHPNASDWLEYGLTQVNTVTEHQFTHDGIYKEGGHYWVYSAINFIPFLWHYLNVSGVDLFPDYKSAFTWPVAVRMGQGWIPNFEDSYIKPAPTHLVANAYQSTPTDFHSSASLGNILQWNFTNAKIFDPSYTGATNDVTWEIDNFILYDASIEPITPDCHPTVKLEGGQIAFRNQWEKGDGHRYLLFHGPAPGDNHNHPDQLSYVFEAGDGFLAPDAGYGPDGFSDDRRNSWYTTNQAHNIITANFYAPMYIPANVTAPTPYFIKNDFFEFAEKQMAFKVFGDLTQKRGIAFIGRNYWIVTDLLVGGTKDYLYRSYFHGRGSFTRDGNYASWTTPYGRYGTSVRLDGFFFPADMTISEQTGYLSLFKDEGTYTYLAMDQQAQDAMYMNIFIPNNVDADIPIVSDLSETDLIAALVTLGDTTDMITLQLNSVERSVGTLMTDGTLAWTRSIQSALNAFAFREATKFIASEFSFQCSQILTLTGQFEQSHVLDLHIAPISNTTHILLVKSQLAQEIDTIKINNIPAQFTKIGNDSIRIRVNPDGTTPVEQTDIHMVKSYLIVMNYPNPFNANTTILLTSHQTGKHVFTIYNMLGQKVWKRFLTIANKGQICLNWDGRDSLGNLQPTGIYIGHFQRKETGETKQIKMMMIK